MNNKVKFLRGTSNEYAVAEKDSDTIYFTTDDGKLYIGDKEISGTGSLTIDDTLSDTSTNPVQNKVVKQAIDNKADKTTATTSADGLMSAEDKSKLDDADNTYALKSKYGDTTIDVGRKAGTTIGNYSTAEGAATTASGNFSHAEGAATTASGNFSHAEGAGTTASGLYSHAEGYETTASGGSSHAGGTGTKALHDNEVAYGRYNKSNSDTVFSVGDGTSDTARHNAFEITTTGGMLHDKDIATTNLIPTELPANGGNADTLGGFPAATFMRYETPKALATSINDMTTTGTYGVYSITPDFPVGYGSWGFLEVRRFGNLCYQSIIFETGIVITRGKDVTTDIWTEWHEPYTNIDKPYVTGQIAVSYSTEVQSFTCLDFTPSAVICHYPEKHVTGGTIKWATPITNGFSLLIDDTTANYVDYIAFK